MGEGGRGVRSGGGKAPTTMETSPAAFTPPERRSPQDRSGPRSRRADWLRPQLREEPVMHLRIPLLFFVLAALALAASAPASAAGSPLWGQLEPGPYAVGFRQIERSDHSRLHRLPIDMTGAPVKGERSRFGAALRRSRQPGVAVAAVLRSRRGARAGAAPRAARLGAPGDVRSVEPPALCGAHPPRLRGLAPDGLQSSRCPGPPGERKP
jgi:hypothetical protein